MSEEKNQEGIIQGSKQWGSIILGAWIGLNIIIPLALLRVPIVQKYLVELDEKIPFDLPGVG